MIKKILFALCVLTSAPAVMAQGATKLGHIDRQALMLMLPERKDAETRMQGFANDLKKKLDAMGAEFDSKKAEYQAKASTMTATEKELAESELSDLAKRIQDAQDKAQESLSKQEEELLAPMIERTNKAIKDVASENGFTYILDSSQGAVIYFDGGIDILPLVKGKLGIL